MPLQAPRQDDANTHQPQQRRADRLPPDPFMQQQRGEVERDQRRDEGQGNRFGQRHPHQRPEEQQRHDRHDGPAQQMDAQHRATGPALARDQHQAQTQHRPRHRAPEQGVVEADGEAQPLHRGVHHRKQRHTGAADGKGDKERATAGHGGSADQLNVDADVQVCPDPVGGQNRHFAAHPQRQAGAIGQRQAIGARGG